MSEPWSPPTDLEWKLAEKILAPWRLAVRPTFSGLENVPSERPLLFVANHTLFGILDVPFLYTELRNSFGIELRGLGDHFHFSVPGWRSLLTHFGVVRGTPPNCARLMEDGQCVLVFPGGAREVTRRRGELHTLIWKRRIGFARLALRHGCTIVPVSAVGMDEAIELMLDSNELLELPVVGRILRKRVRDDLLFPIPRRYKNERLYFHISDPVRVTPVAEPTDEQCFALRTEVAQRIEAGIAMLLDRREHDPLRHPISTELARLRARVRPG